MTSFAVVVNDDPTQLHVLCGLVRKAGIEPRGFASAEDALAAMSAVAGTADGVPGPLPALVVTDLYMPDIDGWRFCRLLRSPDYAACNQIPILVVSATFAGEETDRITAELGADAFVPAPVDGRRFVDQVQAILRGDPLRIPLRVLIVEDSTTLARLLAKTFTGHGYQADTALTAGAAAGAFKTTAYDVAVLDYHLPDGKGDALLEAFRAERPDCVCIMMTTDPGPDLALDWMKRGAAAYLRKPFEPGYLIELCAKARRERALLRVQDLLEERTRELRETNELFSLFMRHSPIYTYIKTVTPTESRVLQASENYGQMIGISAADLVGKTMADLFPPDLATKMTADDWAVVTQGHVLKLDEELHGRHYTSIKFPIVQRDKTLLAGYTIDITDRTRAEQEREKLRAQLNQASRMESVGRLAGGVAHDFNNMLGAILGYAELALEQVDPAHPLHADLEEIRKAATRSADLTRQLLAFARKQTVAPKVLDLNETVAGVLTMLGRLIGEAIQLRWRPGAAVWPVRVDPSQVDQVLANLCVNARDAIAGVGTITIETGNSSVDAEACAAHPGLVPGEYARIVVSDDGCGMDTETQAHVFEPFFTTKDMGKGTGLGLATVYGAVKQNNGFIHVSSEPGQGATFTIYLPRHGGKAGQAQTAGPAGPPVRGHETILVVEDEPAILKLTTLMLERQGFTVLAACAPGEAIRLAREYAGEIRLLITDVVMPEMNGRDLARNLLSLYPHLTRLFMSGYTADVIADQGVLDDGVFFIQKPFTIKALAAKVREALDQA